MTEYSHNKLKQKGAEFGDVRRTIPVRPSLTAPIPIPSSVGARLRQERELRSMSLEEVSRLTRIPLISLERMELDRFDELPGEVFVRGFLRSYARTVGLEPDEILAHYSASRRLSYVAPSLPVAASVPRKQERRRVGVAVAFLLLLVLCTMAISFVLKPRGRDLPAEVSCHEPQHSLADNA